MEIWKDIEGYEGYYQISSYGRIKSLERKYKKRKCEEKILNPFKAKGYLKISLNKHGKRKSKLMHRLVAEAFIPNPNNLPQVNHKDENRQNNKLENLEWVNPKQNLDYGNHNLRKYVSLTIHYTKLNKPEEKEIIKVLQEYRQRI